MPIFQQIALKFSGKLLQVITNNPRIPNFEFSSRTGFIDFFAPSFRIWEKNEKSNFSKIISPELNGNRKTGILRS